MKKHVYIAAPLGAGADREFNRARAARWVAWAADQGVIPVATWITLSGVWSEDRREEGLALDLEQISRCNEVWLCGPRVSTGMTIEATHAHKIEVPVEDFTWHGLVDPVSTGLVSRRWTP